MLTKTGGLIPFEEPPAFGDMSENPVLNPDNRQKDQATNGPSSMFDSFDQAEGQKIIQELNGPKINKQKHEKMPVNQKQSPVKKVDLKSLPD